MMPKSNTFYDVFRKNRTSSNIFLIFLALKSVKRTKIDFRANNMINNGVFFALQFFFPILTRDNQFDTGKFTADGVPYTVILCVKDKPSGFQQPSPVAV